MENEKTISYFRPEIDAMSGYTPGEQPKMPGLLKINTNENPYPPAPGVLKALHEFDYERLKLYPDPTADALRTQLARMFDLQKENVICGNGSDDILTITVRCFAAADRPVACLNPSYSLYPDLAALQGAPCIKINLAEDFSLPVDLLEQAGRANLLMIARPNAPTGNTFPKSIIAEICRNFHGMVLIDEAYADFADDSCVDLVKVFSNVIVSRTFSKSRCLAGLRFGYAFAAPQVIEGMMKMKDSYNVSMLTQTVAKASLDDPAYFAECVRKIKFAREMLLLGLYDLGFSVKESKTNFLFASPPDGDGERCFRELRKRGILVRFFAGPVTGKYVRITIGTPSAISRFYTAAKEIYSDSCQNAVEYKS